MSNQGFAIFFVTGKCTATPYLLYNGSASRIYAQTKVIYLHPKPSDLTMNRQVGLIYGRRKALE